MAGFSRHCHHPGNLAEGGIVSLTHQSGLALQGSIPHPIIFFFQKVSQPCQAASALKRKALSTTPASFPFPFSPLLLFLHRGYTGLSQSTHIPHHVSPPDASSLHPHLPESCLCAGRGKFKSLRTLYELGDLEEVMCVYCVSVSSFANEMVIAALEG